MKWTHQLLVYADVNIMGGSVHPIEKNAGALVVAGKEIGVEVNCDRTKYIVMSRDQNAARSQNIKTDNMFFKMAKHFKYLGTTLRNQILFRRKLRAD